nr:dinitrogenase iron-molybdenum cofactor biosynthesis protein [Bacteroidota bacterium]
MKTIITAAEPNLKSLMDLRFGRCQYFCLFDDANGGVSFIKNEGQDAQGGAGTKAAEKMISLGVKRIISGDFGPKAKELLDKFQIQLIKITDNNKSINEIISSIK